MDGYKESNKNINHDEGQLTLEKSYANKIILIGKVIQKSERCLCYNMYDCNCRPIIRSNYCFDCRYYKCTNKRFSKRRSGLFIWNSGGSLARSNSVNEIDIQQLKKLVNKYQMYNFQRKSDATAITRKVMITPLKISVAILS
ncbi:unnamed protein product [Rhizophagus irregularis]|nr:unnamed protein product [Rhizophagus irregularis]CAB5380482.1 unnamed protein product [Rhizophagus irregularis]